MRSIVVWIVTGLLLVAAGGEDDAPGKPQPAVKRGDLLVWPAATEEVREKIRPCQWSAKTPSPDESEFVEVLVTAEGKTWCGGAIVTLPELRKRLRSHADRSRDAEHPKRPSRVAVLIHASASAPWRAVRFVMMCCTMPEVRMPRVYLAARGRKDGAVFVKCFPPLDRVTASRRFTESMINIALLRERTEESTRFVIVNRYFGTSEHHNSSFMERLYKVASAGRRFPAEIHAEPWVPVRHVMQAYAIFRTVGTPEVIFLGVPVPDALRDSPKKVPAADPEDGTVVPGGKAAADAMPGRPRPPVRREGLVVWPATDGPLRRCTLPPVWRLAAERPVEPDFVEVVVAGNETVYCGGGVVTWPELETLLAAHADRAKGADKPTAALLIHASNYVRWPIVCRVMQTGVSSKVGMRRIYFALPDPLWKPVLVRVLGAIDRERRSGTSAVRLDVWRRKDESRPRVRLRYEDLGTGHAAFRKALARLEKLPKKDLETTGEIFAGDRATFAAVVNSLHAFRAAGIETVRLGDVSAPKAK